MKHVIRIMIVLLLSICLAFASAFPKGIIAFKNGTQIRVKKVSIEDHFVFYKYQGESRSNLLEDVEFIKARGKVTRLIGNITGGASAVLFGYGAVRILTGQASYGPTDTGAKVYYIVAASTTTLLYLGGRLVGSVFDPMHKIYSEPAPMGE